jgi:tetratricopeptide (TPR) repeat protein
VIRFTDKTLGLLESVVRLTDIPQGKLSRNALLQLAEDLKDDDPAAALKAYEETIEAYPEYAYGLNAAAWFLVRPEAKQLRDPKRAIVWARKAVQVTEEKNGYYLDTLAVALHEDGQLEEAARLQQRAAELAPNRDEIVRRAKQYAEELKKRK